jgi:hypothetical protein
VAEVGLADGRTHRFRLVLDPGRPNGAVETIVTAPDGTTTRFDGRPRRGAREPGSSQGKSVVGPEESGRRPSSSAVEAQTPIGVAEKSPVTVSSTRSAVSLICDWNVPPSVCAWWSSARKS